MRPKWNSETFHVIYSVFTFLIDSFRHVWARGTLRMYSHGVFCVVMYTLSQQTLCLETIPQKPCEWCVSERERENVVYISTTIYIKEASFTQHRRHPPLLLPSRPTSLWAPWTPLPTPATPELTLDGPGAVSDLLTLQIGDNERRWFVLDPLSASFSFLFFVSKATFSWELQESWKRSLPAYIKGRC